MEEGFQVTGVSRLSALFGCLRLEQLATASVYLVLVYLINVMFFFPIGDHYLKEVLLLAIISCLAYRKAEACWSAGAVRALLLPMSLYTLVLVASYLINDGFMSTIRSFFYCSLFVYAASVVRLQPRYIGFLCLLAAVEMPVLIYYQCFWNECSRFGGFTNPIFFAMFSVCVAVFSVYLAGTFTRRRIRALLYLAALVFCCAAAFTKTRGAMIALVPLALIFAVYLYRHKLLTVRRVLLAMVAATFLTGFVGLQTDAYERFAVVDEQLAPALVADDTNGNSYRSSIGFRILIWKFSLAVAMEHPLFGVGNERFQHYKQEWVDEGRFPAELVQFVPGAHSHNQYFQDLAMRGVIGLVALLAMFVMPALRYYRMSKAHNAVRKCAGYLGLSLVTAFATFSLTEVALKHPEKVAIFAILGFVALTLGRNVPEPTGETA